MFDLKFQKACEKLGVTKKLPVFEQYITYLSAANKEMNLIGRQQTLDRIYHYHLLDSLLLLPYLKERVLCDIGSGAGFPALCWAMACDDLEITLIEKSPKKSLFLTNVVKELDLCQRVNIINERVEQVRLTFDLMSCRAFASIENFLKLTDHLGHKKSKWWLLKAKNETIQEEVKFVDQTSWNINIVPLFHPTQDVTRNLVEVTRKD